MHRIVTARQRTRQACANAGVAVRLAVLVLADVILISGGVLADAGAYEILGAHAALVSGFGWMLWPPNSVTQTDAEQIGPDHTMWVLSVLLVFLAGPPGAVAVALIGYAERWARPPADILEAWHRWLAGEDTADATRAAHEAILAGRHFLPDASNRRSFMSVMEQGSLREKQALLGHVGLAYQHDYLPLLQLALRSPESAVRAQAAAVFVKLKDQFRRRLVEACVAAGEPDSERSPAAMMAVAETLLDCGRSGFLDKTEARDAFGRAKELTLRAREQLTDMSACDRLLSHILAATVEDEKLAFHMQANLAGLDAGAKANLARFFMRSGRHAELSNLLAFGPLGRQPAKAGAS